MLECVVNVSEGRRTDRLDALARACGPPLLDVHTDPDHHRSVFTIASVEAGDVEATVRRLAVAAAEQLSLTDHTGVHPRLGVIDVVPFVALDGTPALVAVEAAGSFAHWIGRDLGVPAFLYDRADPAGRTLPEVRRDAFRVRAPDAGPAAPHRDLGACAVGARDVLVAVNLELERDDVDLARTVARQIRARDGGLPGVRALGFELTSREAAQVSMNLVALDETGLETACVAAREQVEALGGRVRRLELVGLVPAAVLAACSDEFLQWSGLDANVTIELRAAAATGGRVASDAPSADARPGEGRASPA